MKPADRDSLSLEKTEERLLCRWQPTSKRRLGVVAFWVIPSLFVALPAAALFSSAGWGGAVVASFMAAVVGVQICLELTPIEITATRTHLSVRRKALPWAKFREIPVDGVIQFQAIFERRSAVGYVGGITDLDAVYEDGRRATLIRQLPRLGVTRRLANALNCFYGFPEFAPKKSLISFGE